MNECGFHTKHTCKDLFLKIHLPNSLLYDSLRYLEMYWGGRPFHRSETNGSFVQSVKKRSSPSAESPVSNPRSFRKHPKTSTSIQIVVVHVAPATLLKYNRDPILPRCAQQISTCEDVWNFVGNGVMLTS